MGGGLPQDGLSNPIPGGEWGIGGVGKNGKCKGDHNSAARSTTLLFWGI